MVRSEAGAKRPKRPSRKGTLRLSALVITPLTYVGGCSDHESGSDDEDLYMKKRSEELSDTHNERCRYTVARVHARQVDQGFLKMFIFKNPWVDIED